MPACERRQAGLSMSVLVSDAQVRPDADGRVSQVRGVVKSDAEWVRTAVKSHPIPACITAHPASQESPYFLGDSTATASHAFPGPKIVRSPFVCMISTMIYILTVNSPRSMIHPDLFNCNLECRHHTCQYNS